MTLESEGCQRVSSVTYLVSTVPEIQESIVIAATPEKVWKVLMDLASWTQWNTFVTFIKVQPPHTQLCVGSKQIITIDSSQLLKPNQ